MRFYTCLVIIAVAVSNGIVQAYPTAKNLTQGIPSQTGVEINCTHHELKCLAKGQISHVDGECYTPLERGPCPKGQRIVLDPKGVPGQRGRCAAQPCPSREIQLLPVTGRCLTMAKAETVLCAKTELHLDATGSPKCGQFPGWTKVLQQHIQCLKKKAKTQSPGGHVEDIIRIANILCAKDNNGECVPKNTGINPSIVLKPEE